MDWSGCQEWVGDGRVSGSGWEMGGCLGVGVEEGYVGVVVRRDGIGSGWEMGRSVSGSGCGGRVRRSGCEEGGIRSGWEMGGCLGVGVEEGYVGVVVRRVVSGVGRRWEGVWEWVWRKGT